MPAQSERTESVQEKEQTVLKENEDFYIDENGLFILTRKYLENRGSCCELRCQNCPYGFTQPVDE